MSASIAEQIADFALTLRLEDIPTDVKRLAQLHILDAVGVAAASASGAVQREMAHIFQTSANGVEYATVIGSRQPFPGPTAALLNGSYVHALEYDDTHMESIVHGSAVILPAALAAGEANMRTWGEMVRMVCVGWEALVRLGLAAPGAFQRRGFQVTAVGGALVAALIGAIAARCDRHQVVCAQGIAGSQASGVFEFLSDGSTVKALHPGWAAHSGLMASQLARAGMTGPRTIYEGKFGLFRCYTDEPDGAINLQHQIEHLGDRWVLREAAFKLYPVCHYIHPFLECIEALKPAIGSIDRISSIQCEVPLGASAIICEPWDKKQQPLILNEAKHSLPYCLALCLLDIPLTASYFMNSRVLTDACELAHKIAWKPLDSADFPRRFQAVVHVNLVSGQTLTQTVDQVRGSPQRPATERELLDKFAANCGLSYAPAATDAIEDFVLNADFDQPIQTLSGILRSSNS